MKVVIAAQHALLREGLRELLGRWSEVEVLRVVPDAADGAHVARRSQADVLLLVRGEDPHDDAQAIASLKTTRGTCRVVLLEGAGRRRSRETLGADCCLGAGIGSAGLVRALWAACGRTAGDTTPRGGEDDGAPDPPSVSGEPQLLLHPREAEVVRAVCAGLPSKIVAGQLGITEKTVKNHLSNIYQRLGLAGRVELVVWAIGRGLLAESPVRGRDPDASP